MSAPAENAFKLRWLAEMRTAPGLSNKDRQAGEWLADNLQLGTIVLRQWWDLRKGTGLSNLDAGVAVGNLARAGFVGKRVRTGPAAGFPLQFPQPVREPLEKPQPSETRAQVEARNARRAAAQRAADLRADAKWLSGR